MNLFSQNGIKRVSMDDVARKASVSKRTLYEFFKDKESLLMAVLDKIHEPFAEHIKLAGKRVGTALEVLLLLNEKIMERPIWACEEFFEDIIRYPNALEALMKSKHEFLSKIMEILKRGAKESVFMSDINYDIISIMAQHRFNQSKPLDLYIKYTREEVHDTIFFIFLRGICTDRGRDILDKFVLKKKYESEYAQRDL